MGLCPKCNVDYGDRTPKFCPSCGANIETVISKAAAVQAKPPSPEEISEAVQEAFDTPEVQATLKPVEGSFGSAKPQSAQKAVAPVAPALGAMTASQKATGTNNAPLAPVIGQSNKASATANSKNEMPKSEHSFWA